MARLPRGTALFPYTTLFRSGRGHPHPGRGPAAGAVRDPLVNEQVSPRRRREVIDALRRGNVPANGLDLLAVGLERFTPALDRSEERRVGKEGTSRASLYH